MVRLICVSGFMGTGLGMFETGKEGKIGQVLGGTYRWKKLGSKAGYT